MRKYDARIDIFTKLDASTKRVCPAIEACWCQCGSAANPVGRRSHLSASLHLRDAQVPDMDVPSVHLSGQDNECCGPSREDL
jgi:hypothetical protein